jgi:hypothetical protein
MGLAVGVAWLFCPPQIIFDVLDPKPQLTANFDESDFPLVSEPKNGLGINL